MSLEIAGSLTAAFGKSLLTDILNDELVRIASSVETSRKGLIISGPSGCGKTTLLRLISKYFSYEVCHYYQHDQGLSIDFGTANIVLIDDIDSLADTALILNAIDNSIQCFYLCACSSTEKLDKRLCVDYRLGMPINFPPVPFEVRFEWFSTLVRTQDEVNDNIAIKLALATRSSSVSEITRCARDIYFAPKESRAAAMTLIGVESAGDSDSSVVSASISDIVNLGNIQRYLLNAIYSPFLADKGVPSAGHRSSTGFVIHGSSGTGKSCLVNWLAASIKRHFNLVSVSCSDLIHKVVGETEKYISQIFDKGMLASLFCFPF